MSYRVHVAVVTRALDDAYEAYGRFIGERLMSLDLYRPLAKLAPGGGE